MASARVTEKLENTQFHFVLTAKQTMNAIAQHRALADEKQRGRSTSLICRVSRPTICTLGTSLPRNRSARIRASTLSVLICAWGNDVRLERIGQHDALGR